MQILNEMKHKKEQKMNIRLEHNMQFSLPVVQLERVLFGGGSVLLGQCTAEVAHFSLQWWAEPSTLKHQSNPEGESLYVRDLKNVYKSMNSYVPL